MYYAQILSLNSKLYFLVLAFQILYHLHTIYFSNLHYFPLKHILHFLTKEPRCTSPHEKPSSQRPRLCNNGKEQQARLECRCFVTDFHLDVLLLNVILGHSKYYSNVYISPEITHTKINGAM